MPRMWSWSLPKVIINIVTPALTERWLFIMSRLGNSLLALTQLQQTSQPLPNRELRCVTECKPTAVIVRAVQLREKKTCLLLFTTYWHAAAPARIMACTVSSFQNSQKPQLSTISWTSTVQHVDECRWDWNILGMYQCRAFPWSGLVCWTRWDQESSWNWTFPSWSSCHAWIQIPASVKWNNFFLYSELICLHFELLHQCLFDCCHHNQRFRIRELSIILYQLPNAPSYLSSMVTSDLVM